MAQHGPSNEARLDVEAVLDRVPFQSPAQARQSLAGVLGNVPPEIASHLIALLEDSSNPDAALNLFERFARERPEVLRELERHTSLIHYALLVFSNSRWLGETLIRNPDLLLGFAREHSLDRIRSREELRESFARVRSRSFETDISTLLAGFKRREYVRIMLRDLLGMATLAETTAEISALSDVLIEEALVNCESAMRNRYELPQHVDEEGRLVETPFAVLSLGKLGGNELNYSSDIDLLYIYGSGREPGTESITNREYFVRLAQEVTEVLSRITREGAVFRIDLRLRPQGAEGEPAISLDHARRYYRESAHDWELQALIKVRHSAGDHELARAFVRDVQQYVYRGDLNLAAIETALQARSRMGHRRRRGGPSRRATIDVKLDRGGIRDIEFLVQCLQRVYGGAEQWLRSSGTLFALQKLHDKNHISGKDFHELTSSYEFLRKIEHRLQLQNGQQTHSLPHSRQDLWTLQRSVFGNDVDRQPIDLVDAVRSRMEAISEIYKRIIHQQRRPEDSGELRLVPGPDGGSTGQSQEQLLARLAADSPELYQIATDEAVTGHTRKNLNRFLEAARTSSARYAAVLEHPRAVQRALPIFAASEFLTELLLRHPEEIRVLAEEPENTVAGESLFRGEEQKAGASDPVFEYLSMNPENTMALLRRHYRHRVFRSGARDVLESRRIFESLESTSLAAEQAIAAAHTMAGGSGKGFCVLALGRLGTREFDVLSDADLVFVRDEGEEAQESTKLAVKIIEVLSAYTNEGSLFPVDARLRPHGAEGDLVTTPGQLSAYFANEAEAWEALTYLKLRYICGDQELAERSISAVRAGSRRFSEYTNLTAELRAMRNRLADAESGAGLNLKTSPGAVYDVDFLAGYLEMKMGSAASGKNLEKRLVALRDSGVLDQEHWKYLTRAAELYRASEHAVRLVTGRGRKDLPMGESALRNAERLVERILGRTLPRGLEAELREAMPRVREIYNTILSD